jgi:catechol 2,3-dioxygenase-like lactoylglutathione lyase family enzyme
MAVSLNHTIVVARDKEITAKFLTDVLGLSPHVRLGHFAVVHVGETSLDFVVGRSSGSAASPSPTCTSRTDRFSTGNNLPALCARSTELLR